MSSGRPSTRLNRFAIVATIFVILVVSALAVALFRALGGDEPAPMALTSAETSSVSTISTSRTPTTEEDAGITTTATTPPQPVSTGIRDVNWKAQVRAQPMVKDVENVIYADLDGDGAEDALVLVRTEGSGAYLDYYVFSMRGGTPAVLFERHEVQRGKVELGAQAYSFVETVPVYGPSDPNCCPGNLKKTTFAWSPGADAFVEASVETVPAPAQ